jgi:hypothetical protein
MNVVWVRIRSWHAIGTFDLAGPTLCGRRPKAQSDIASELPAGKSCETCLRIVARKADEPEPENEDVGE